MTVNESPTDCSEAFSTRNSIRDLQKFRNVVSLIYNGMSIALFFSFHIPVCLFSVSPSMLFFPVSNGVQQATIWTANVFFFFRQQKTLSLFTSASLS